MQQIFDTNHFEHFEKRFRINFFNSISGFKAVNLVGTQSVDGVSNLAIFSSIFHMGSNPAYFGMLFRPSQEVPRHTLSNILATGYYTINTISDENYKQAHQTSAKYDWGVSEFVKCGFEEEYIRGFKAPFVRQSQIKMGLELLETHEMKFNNTLLVVGKVVLAVMEASFLEADGFINHSKAHTVTSTGLDAYFQTEIIDRLSYAKPDKELFSI